MTTGPQSLEERVGELEAGLAVLTRAFDAKCQEVDYLRGRLLRIDRAISASAALLTAAIENDDESELEQEEEAEGERPS